MKTVVYGQTLIIIINGGNFNKSFLLYKQNIILYGIGHRLNLNVVVKNELPELFQRITSSGERK